MEKKFKCKDEVIVRFKEPGCCWFYGVVSHSDDASVVLSGGFRHPYERYDILPYEGHENLVGTTTDEPEEEVTIKEGDLVYAFDCINRLQEYNIKLGKFERLCQYLDNSGLFYVSGIKWLYCIPFSKFNPDDMEATRKEVLTVRNGKLVKANIK